MFYIIIVNPILIVVVVIGVQRRARLKPSAHGTLPPKEVKRDGRRASLTQQRIERLHDDRRRGGVSNGHNLFIYRTNRVRNSTIFQPIKLSFKRSQLKTARFPHAALSRVRQKSAAAAAQNAAFQAPSTRHRRKSDCHVHWPFFAHASSVILHQCKHELFVLCPRA